MNVESLVAFYQMKAHPEGGFYKETYRSVSKIVGAALPKGFTKDRAISTAICFLLPVGSFSAFHRIKSDEMWHFYKGCRLHIHVIHPDGHYELMQLGADYLNGESFQLIVPANSWFASEPIGEESAFSFVGCTVAPGFDFEDFELADADILSQQYPEHEALIRRLTR